MLDRTIAGGLSFWIPARDDGVGSSLRAAGEFAQPEVDLLLALHAPRPDLTFVDVGANIGAIALPFASQSPDTPVIACEAHPALHAILCANVVANGLMRVSALNCAVSNKLGIARFPAPPIDSARNFGATGFSSAVEETTPVMLTTLDALLGGRPIGTLKIDVEGHEAQVLSGASETITRDQPAVLFEAKTGSATDANTAWFLDRGFALYWFFAPFVTPTNAKGAPVDRSHRGDINLLALPKSREPPWPLPRVVAAGESWKTRMNEMTYLETYGIKIGA